MFKTYCAECNRDASHSDRVCACGSTKFISGKVEILNNNNITCKCGCMVFSEEEPCKFTDFTITKINCIECENNYVLYEYNIQPVKE